MTIPIDQQLTAAIESAISLTQAVQVWKGDADAALAAALAAVPLTEKVIYLDQVAGNDANTGLTALSPLKTLAAAIARVPVGGVGNIKIKGGTTYTLEADINVVGRNLTITGDGAPVSFSSQVYVQDNTNCMRSLRLDRASINFGNLQIAVPVKANGAYPWGIGLQSLVKPAVFGTSLQIIFTGCNCTANDAELTSLVSAQVGSQVDLAFYSGSFASASGAGRVCALGEYGTWRFSVYGWTLSSGKPFDSLPTARADGVRNLTTNYTGALV